MAVWTFANKSELAGKVRIDPEYYHPKYLNNEDKILSSGFPVKPLNDLIYPIKNGFDYRNFSDKGKPYIRVGDLLFGEVVYREAEKIEIPGTELKKNITLKCRDILFSRKGTFGRSAVVEEAFLNAVISSEVMLIRIKSEVINPYYLSAFLNSRIGYYQVERRTHGVSNFSISQRDVGDLKIVIAPLKFQKSIAEAISRAYKNFESSYELYLQAEQTLLDELGWDTLDLSQPKSFSVQLNKTNDVSRVDAEHFQPKYERLIQHLVQTKKSVLLEDVVTSIGRGFQPEYVNEGEVLVFTEKHLGRYLMNVGNERTSFHFWKKNRKARVNKFDLLLYSIGAYIGRCNCYLGNEKAITSTNVSIIRVNERKINPIYISVFLNSPCGQMQAEKWTASVGQMALYSKDISKFIIYRLAQNIQEKIADLVLQSYQARKKAKAFLENAKSKVEELIERKSS